MSRLDPHPAARPETPFAVTCRTHGLVYLTHAEYLAQLDDVGGLWRCPLDGTVAEWNDANYEARIESWPRA